MNKLEKLNDRLNRYQNLLMVRHLECKFNKEHNDLEVVKRDLDYKVRCKTCGEESIFPYMLLDDEIEVLIISQETKQERYNKELI